MFGLAATGLVSGLLGSMLNAGAGLTTGLIGASQAAESNKRNIREASRQFDENMAWQREQFSRMVDLANTAHQREVADLRAAGLNPILSATGGSGASTVSGVGSAPVTAHSSDLDLASSLKMISDSISGAADQALKTSDTASMIGLREAQSSQALSEAAKNDKLTPAMRNELLQRANSAAAAANYHNTLSAQSETLTPLQGALLREQTAREQADAYSRRINNKWIDKKNQFNLMSQAAKIDFMRNQTRVNQVNAARSIFDSVRDIFMPRPRFRFPGNSGSGDYLGDLIFNR